MKKIRHFEKKHIEWVGIFYMHKNIFVKNYTKNLDQTDTHIQSWVNSVYSSIKIT